MLKPTEKEFHEVIEGIGTFTFKFPTLMDDLKADTLTNKLLGGNENPTIVALNIATMLGTLSAAIVEKPNGFDLENIYSYEELEIVYNAFVAKVLAFRNSSAFSKQSGAEKEVTGRSKKSKVLVPPEV